MSERAGPPEAAIIEGPLSGRYLRVVVALGFAVRVFASALTGSPHEFALQHLGLAERLAAGDLQGFAAGEVAPLWPALLAPLLVAESTEVAFRGAQFVAAVCGALSIVPIAGLAERLRPGIGRSVAVLLIVTPLAVRSGAEALPSALFQLLAAGCLVSVLAQRGLLAVLAGAAATLVHPAALLLPVFAVSLPGPRRWRSAGLAAGGWLTGVALYAALQLGGGSSWQLVPGWTECAVAIRGDVSASLLRVPLDWVGCYRAQGLLALLGLWMGRREDGQRIARFGVPLAALAAALCGGAAWQHVLWLPVVLLAAGAALHALGERARVPVLMVAVLVGLIGSLRLQPKNWIGEQTVGAYLGRQMQQGEELVSDLPRIRWTAGRSPARLGEAPPTLGSLRDLPSAVRFVVLSLEGDGRGAALEAAAPTFRSYAMPEDVRLAAQRRGLLVLERAR